MIFQIFILSMTISMGVSAPAANPDPHPVPAADPAPNPKPGLAPLVYTPPVAVSYNAFSALQAHPSSVVVKSAPAVVPAVSALPAVYTLQAQAAPALGYAFNYPYVVV